MEQNDGMFGCFFSCFSWFIYDFVWTVARFYVFALWSLRMGKVEVCSIKIEQDKSTRFFMLNYLVKEIMTGTTRTSANNAALNVLYIVYGEFYGVKMVRTCGFVGFQGVTADGTTFQLLLQVFSLLVKKSTEYTTTNFYYL